MPNWYTSPPAFSSLSWSMDFTPDEVWWYAIWDIRVVNMFVNAINERLKVENLIPTLSPAAVTNDDMGNAWLALIAAVDGQFTSTGWLRTDFDPTGGFSNSGGLGVPNITTYQSSIGWHPTDVGQPYMKRFRYPREIKTLTDHGEAGWRAMYIGNRTAFGSRPEGPPVGKIFSHDGTSWTQEPDATSSGTPDLVRPDPTTGLFTTGWNATAACLDGYVLNWLRDVIDLLVFGVEVSSTPGQWWTTNGRSNVGNSPLIPFTSGTAAACVADYNGGSHILTGVGGPPRVQGTASFDSGTGFFTYHMEKVENHISAQIAGAGITRQLTYYSPAYTEHDYLGNPDFAPQDTGYSNYSEPGTIWYFHWTVSTVGGLGGLLVNSPTFGDLTNTPSLPAPPPVTGTNAEGAGQQNHEQYRLSRYDVAGGFKYVSGYGGT